MRANGRFRGIWTTGTLLFLAIAAASAQEPAAMRTSVSQFGVTWTFDQPRLTGQFVNGDWWVVGPTTVVSVSPAPQAADPAGVGEEGRYAYIRDFVNQFGDTAFANDPRMRNGSMVDPTWNGAQGYDSGARNYNASLSVSFPLALGVDQSLVSSISHTDMPNPPILPFYRDVSGSVTRTHAVLTCLGAQPAADAFRPPYAAGDKPIHRASDLRRDLLPSLAPTPSTPSLAEMERLVERPWIDHVASWMAANSAGSENTPNYGREYARAVSLVGLRLMLDDPIEDKETLLIGFVQVGIDLQGVRENGARWQMGGGITSGRKWPILFAGIMLDDPAMTTFPGASEFHEDQQTYYGLGWNGQTILWQMVVHHGIAPTYEERHPDTWDSTDWRSSGYRGCCNGHAWIGEALGALLLNAKQMWNHDAFFDYCDRWMTEDPAPYAAEGINHTHFYRKAFDPFVDQMYRTYRDSIPPQPGATNNMKWVTNRWVSDFNPYTAHAVAGPDRQVDDGGGLGYAVVTLDGSGSYSDAGAIVEYLWAEGDTYLGSGAQASVFLPAGIHTITLTVWDQAGAKDTDTVVVTVRTPELIADAGADRTVIDANGDGFELVTLDGSESVSLNGPITDYVWSLGAGGTPVAFNAVADILLPVGVHEIALTVINADGTDEDAVEITVEPASAPIGGDANGDGSVDLADFTILKDNFGASGATWAEGDFDGDGDVDLADFTILKNNYGA